MSLWCSQLEKFLGFDIGGEQPVIRRAHRPQSSSENKLTHFSIQKHRAIQKVNLGDRLSLLIRLRAYVAFILLSCVFGRNLADSVVAQNVKRSTELQRPGMCTTIHVIRISSVGSCDGSRCVR